LLTLARNILLSGMLASGLSLADSSSAAVPANPPTSVLTRYFAAMELQQTRLEGARMEVDIEAQLPRLKKQGKFQALRQVTRVGQVTYDAVRFVGDKMVKNDVITRYLQAEAQAMNGHVNGNGKSQDLRITQANYKFKYKGMISVNGRPMHIYQLSPKKKRVGLFKGDLWIDAETYLPYRETGRLVKNPSVFLKKVEFVRDYEFVNGMALPKRIESRVHTRLIGRAELNISFNNIMPQQRAQLSICPMGW
jgi:hypothetical protein